jgi:hypothetical protein
MTLCAKRVIVFRKAPPPPVRYLSTTMNRSPIALACAFAFAACNQGPSSSAAVAEPAPAIAPATPAAPAIAATPTGGQSVRLGAAISAPEVALADVAKDPESFAGRSFTTRGTVTAVCQSMGCWMEIKDASNGAHLRMHGHSFFVPKTASGRQARVQATLVPNGAAKACADEECASKNLALLQLDATGVELD